MQAVFAPVQFAERPLPFLPAENSAGFDDGTKPWSQQRLAAAEAELQKLDASKNKPPWPRGSRSAAYKTLEDLPRGGNGPTRRTFGLTNDRADAAQDVSEADRVLRTRACAFEPYAFTRLHRPAATTTRRSSRSMPCRPARRRRASWCTSCAGGSLESPADAVTPGRAQRRAGVAADGPQSVGCTVPECRRRAAGWRWPAGSPAATTR